MGTAYKENYETRFKQPVSTFGGYAHDAFILLSDAVTRAGSTDLEAIRDTLEETTGLADTTGIYAMSADDHLGLDLSAFRMLVIKDGSWTIAE